MRLVHGKQRNRHGLRHRLKRGRFEALRGDVDDFVRALPRALHGEFHLARGERAVEVRGWNARAFEQNGYLCIADRREAFVYLPDTLESAASFLF